MCPVALAPPAPHLSDMTELTIATWNMQKGFGTDFRRDPVRAAGVIADLGADIVALQEADRRFRTRAGVLDLARLRDTTGLVPVPIPMPTGMLAHGWHGNLLLARAAEVQEVRTLRLSGIEPRGAIVADLVHDGQPLRVIAVHMGLLRRARSIQAAELAREIADDAERPTLLLGDLNEWRQGAASALAPLYDSFAHAGHGASFPAPMPVLPLDRIFISTRPRAMDVAVHASGDARRASDHLPLVARIRF
jgi:endonuclease/exonuclease/phosphatase family metal-dependent hydrolase